MSAACLCCAYLGTASDAAASEVELVGPVAPFDGNLILMMAFLMSHMESVLEYLM